MCIYNCEDEKSLKRFNVCRFIFYLNQSFGTIVDVVVILSEFEHDISSGEERRRCVTNPREEKSCLNIIREKARLTLAQSLVNEEADNEERES